MLYEFYGYPPDFLERYRTAIEKVTAADVARVAKKYVHKDKVALLVVGKAADLDKPLSTFGAVQTVDITIPEPGADKKKAAPSR
jgi:zinc protease